MATIKKGGVELTSLEKANFRTAMEIIGTDDGIALSAAADLKPAPVDADYWPLWDTESDPPGWVLVRKADMLAGLTSTISAMQEAIDALTDALTDKQDTLISGLSIVQEPDKATNFYGTSVTRSLAEVGSGNHLVVVVRAPTAVGAPVLSDSASGSWGAPVHSYAETGNGSTAYYFIQANVISGLTSITATVASAGEIEIGAVEVSGGTPVLDATGGELQTTAATVWNHAFTSTEDDVLFIGMGALSNGATAAGTAPATSSAVAADYFYYARGLFPTAGSNTAVVTLSDVRSGARSWIVVRGS